MPSPRTASRSIRAPTSSCRRILADGGAGCITAASNTNSHWGGIVYAKRTGPEADAAQAVLNATRKAATSVPLIPGLREIIARSTGDDGWRTIRPPHLKLERRRPMRSGRPSRRPARCRCPASASKAAE